MASHLRVRAIISAYRDRLAYFQGLQQLPGSTWTDADVTGAMRPYRDDAKQALYRVGLDADQVASLLAEPEPTQPPPRSLSQYINERFRARGE